jgi:O-antigen ligase
MSAWALGSDPTAPSARPLLFWSIWFIGAALLGTVIAASPWWWLSLLVFAVPAAVLWTAWAPHVGLFLTLILIFEVVPSDYLPKLPFGGGNLKIYDLCVVYLVTVAALRGLAQSAPIRAYLGKLWLPLLVFFGFLGVSFLYGVMVMHNKLALAEGRNFVGWLVIPLVVLGVDSPRRFRSFFIGMLVIAIVIACYVTIQSLLNVQIMTDARVEALDTGNKDVTRSIAGGATYLIIFFLYYYLNRMIEGKSTIFFAAPVIALMILGLIMSFGRGVWMTSAAGLLISAWLHKGIKNALILGAVGAFLVAGLLAGMAEVKPRFVKAVTERALGIGQEVESGGSLNWRMIENRLAFASMEKHPMMGVGIGGEYKPVASIRNAFDIETAYIHNGYLWFPLKLGLGGIVVPFLLIGGFFLCLRDAYRKTLPTDRALLAAAGGAFSVVVCITITQPEWEHLQEICAIAILMSFTLLAPRFGDAFDGVRREKLAKSALSPVGRRPQDAPAFAGASG